MSWVDALTKLLNSLASVLTALGTLSGFVAAVGAIIALRRTGSVRPNQGEGKHRKRRRHGGRHEAPMEEDDHV